MLTIKINDSTNSKREKDENGFLIIRNNPIAKAGVFDYLLKEVNPNCKDSEANKIVKVYRDWDMLKEIKDSFANKPIKDEHYWVGEESNTADGAIGSVISTDDENLYLIADLFIYNPILIQKIENNEVVELSPAYIAEAIAEKGSFKGVDYEYKQNIKTFNHLAVVKEGRSGKDLKIQDKGIKMKFKDKLFNALSKVFDENPEIQDSDDECKTQDEDKREVIREIMAIAAKSDSEFSGGENEKIETIAKLAEKLAYNPSEAKENDEEVSDDDEEVSDDDEEVSNKTEAASESTEANVNVEELKKEILEEVAEAVSEAVVKAQDSAIKAHRAKEAAYQKVQDSINAPFDYSKMSVSEIYNVGYESLTGSKVSKGLDAETAFSIVVSRAQAKVQDSKNSTTTLNLSKFK
ncbi:DUF2213 domain-containing protein [Helicobacter sp. MIT 05-5294]|uniref:DUF2213 domain-containing protein n=1 Tax=Helicobacter sp. MIT 05-5294 TaxID=1548150 RepID=UPI00051FE90F|nr:DUF2213 domain-containing protein [Helicobacter sp. MIT 05-5294]TLD85799.1 DUF2213 domain-containing protein [Helicobacter sp. MIT 05-5294]